MSVELRNFAVVIPAGTLQTSPQVTDLAMPARKVTGVRVRVPPGPGGTVGWALGSAGTRVIPWGADQWIVADDEIIDEPVEGQIDSGAWQLQAYNEGIFDHTLYVMFRLEPVGGSGTMAPLTPLAL